MPAKQRKQTDGTVRVSRERVLVQRRDLARSCCIKFVSVRVFVYVSALVPYIQSTALSPPSCLRTPSGSFTEVIRKRFLQRGRKERMGGGRITLIELSIGEPPDWQAFRPRPFVVVNCSPFPQGPPPTHVRKKRKEIHCRLNLLIKGFNLSCLILFLPLWPKERERCFHLQRLPCTRREQQETTCRMKEHCKQITLARMPVQGIHHQVRQNSSSWIMNQ
mmetsp:Transcript_46217/g.91103  ORF Transcript_46217/g.91103 Transcript_46217/m.91103 type:complete len:219 (+) Transcript_46217:2826-3482(+)